MLWSLVSDIVLFLQQLMKKIDIKIIIIIIVAVQKIVIVMWLMAYVIYN